MIKKYFPTEQELAIVREHYDGTSLQINKIFRLIGRKYPRWYVGRMARDMGLAKIKEPDWTADEEAYVIEHYPKMGLKALRRAMIANGMTPRSTTAINLKLKRLGAHASADDGFSLRALERFLFAGQEQHHTIRAWIEKGWLKAKRRGTLRLARQGGDIWYVSPEWLRSFILHHPEEIDLRLVDPAPFIRLVAGDNLYLPAQCRCPGCGRTFEKRLFNPGLQLLRIYCDACKQKDVCDADAATAPEAAPYLQAMGE